MALAGSPLLEPDRHNPFPDHSPNVSVQDVLDRALAWAVINREYGIADFLLEHGPDINTRWRTHEPASVLHECAYENRLEQAFCHPFAVNIILMQSLAAVSGSP